MLQYKNLKQLKKQAYIETNKTFEEIYITLQDSIGIKPLLDIETLTPLPLKEGLIKVNHIFGKSLVKFMFDYTYSPENESFFIQTYCYFASEYTLKPMLTFNLQLGAKKNIATFVGSNDEFLNKSALKDFQRQFETLLIYLNLNKNSQENVLCTRKSDTNSVIIPTVYMNSILYTAVCPDTPSINSILKFVSSEQSNYVLAYERRYKDQTQTILPYKKNRASSKKKTLAI